MKYLWLLLISLIAFAALAHGGETTSIEPYMVPKYVGDAALWDQFLQKAPRWVVAMVPSVVIVLTVARTLSSGLFWISRFIPKTRILYRGLKTGIELLAVALGQIGVGMPKKMVLAKAKKHRAAASKASNNFLFPS